MPSKRIARIAEHAFWDASAVAPLCIRQPASADSRVLARRYGIVAWWGTPVEVTSAVARLAREGVLDVVSASKALDVLDALEQSWLEVVPSDQIRDVSRQLSRAYSLRAADSLQLAAGLVWSNSKPSGRVFICRDNRLADAATAIGFDVRRPS